MYSDPRQSRLKPETANDRLLIATTARKHSQIMDFLKNEEEFSTDDEDEPSSSDEEEVGNDLPPSPSSVATFSCYHSS